MPEYLYVIRRPDGVRKVGRSCNPHQRLAQLHREIGADLELEHETECPPDRVANAETYAHYLLRDWRYSGELYEVDADTARQAVDAAAEIAASGEPFPMPKPERLNVFIPTGMRRAIKTWRHRHFIDTEGEAIRQLLRLALQDKGML